MTESNISELEAKRPTNGKPVDEADSIRRWSSGDDMRGGPNAKASIEGGFWLALLALLAVGVIWLKSEHNVDVIRDLASESSAAATRADIAERRANIAELYAKQVFVELNRLGYPVKTPAEEHSVAPPLEGEAP